MGVVPIREAKANLSRVVEKAAEGSDAYRAIAGGAYSDYQQRSSF